MGSVASRIWTNFCQKQNGRRPIRRKRKKMIERRKKKVYIKYKITNCIQPYCIKSKESELFFSGKKQEKDQKKKNKEEKKKKRGDKKKDKKGKKNKSEMD